MVHTLAESLELYCRFVYFESAEHTQTGEYLPSYWCLWEALTRTQIKHGSKLSPTDKTYYDIWISLTDVDKIREMLLLPPKMSSKQATSKIEVRHA